MALTKHWRVASGLAATFALAAAILYTALFTTPERPSDLPEAFIGEPDLYMRDAVITQYESTGQLKYQLASQQIHRFDKDQLTRLSVPELSLFHPIRPPWHIQSTHGDIRQALAPRANEEVVFLHENVELRRDYPDGRYLRLRSPTLYLYPDRQYAETDQDVMIDTDVGRTKAVGLKGDLQQGVLNLFSSDPQRVHTIMLPEQFK